MNKLLRIPMTFLLIGVIAGCQPTNTQTYSSDQYTFHYPDTYLIEEANESFPVLIIKGDEGRIEIFKNEDFNDPLSGESGERTYGYSSSGLEEFEAEYVPKEKSKKGQFDIWIFYKENDENTQKELQDIVQSIELNGENDDVISTISGTALETKDGFYIGNYVLTYEEIIKYDADYKFDDYNNANLEINGKVQEVEMPCETPAGEILQCREGKIKYIYDITAIKVAE